MCSREGKGGKYLICREEEQWRRRNLFGEGKLMVTPMYICWAEKGTRALKSLKIRYRNIKLFNFSTWHDVEGFYHVKEGTHSFQNM